MPENALLAFLSWKLLDCISPNFQHWRILEQGWVLWFLGSKGQRVKVTVWSRAQWAKTYRAGCCALSSNFLFVIAAVASVIGVIRFIRSKCVSCPSAGLLKNCCHLDMVPLPVTVGHTVLLSSVLAREHMLSGFLAAKLREAFCFVSYVRWAFYASAQRSVVRGVLFLSCASVHPCVRPKNHC